MHNASTKQRLAALRRRLGIFSSPPRWVRERRARRLRELEERIAAELPLPAGVEPAGDGGATLLVTAGPMGDGALPVRQAGAAPLVVALPPRVEDASAPGPGDPPRGATGLDRRPPPSARRRQLATAGVLAALAGAALLALRPRAVAPEPGREAASAADASAAQAAAPAPAPTGPAALVVRPGDTLWHLAGRHLGTPTDWPRLHAANHDRVRDPDLIHPGQQLAVPRP